MLGVEIAVGIESVRRIAELGGEIGIRLVGEETRVVVEGVEAVR